MKKTRIMNQVTAAVSLVYAGVATYVFAQVSNIIATTPNFTELTSQEMAQILPIQYVLGILAMILVGIVLFVLGIITLIFNIQLSSGAKGKVLGIVASSMTVGGFILGLFPVVSTVYIITTTIMYIVSAYMLNKE